MQWIGIADGDYSQKIRNLPNLARQYLREQVPIAVFLVLVAIAHQRDLFECSRSANPFFLRSIVE